MNSYTEQEKLVIYAQQIHDSGIDITPDQKNEWTMIAYACASQGEAGREPYHLICSNYPSYDYQESDQHFTYCLTTSRNCVSLGSLVMIAKNHGLELKLPRGRRQKSEDEREQEQQNKIAKMVEFLKSQAEWRYNVWRRRTELKEGEQDWRPIQERDLKTFYCRLLENGLKVKLQDVEAMISNRDFSADYDALNEWLDSLKPWNPEVDPDYLHDFYVGHLGFNDPENEDFYDLMFKKWHVSMVALIRDRSNENPLMPIFKGSQHIGKSYFARHILPPHLSDYRLEPSPTDRIDKDSIISLTETPLIILDEISFGNSQRAEAFKYIITSQKFNVRDAYAHYRESRQRRASLIATTNEDCFIPNTEGTRRYLVVNLKETVDLVNFPLPYEGAYAQALYLLDHGFELKPDQAESQLLTQHNSRYIELNDCEEALKTFVHKPTDTGSSTTISAGELLQQLVFRGFHGKQFTAAEIGKAMKRMGFEKKIIKGKTKYHVVLPDNMTSLPLSMENAQDVKEFIPDAF